MVRVVVRLELGWVRYHNTTDKTHSTQSDNIHTALETIHSECKPIDPVTGEYECSEETVQKLMKLADRVE